MLLDLLQKIFEQEKMPEEWRGSVIVPIFKEKGGHPGLWELQRHQDDITYHEDLGKNSRQKTEGRDKQSSSVSCRAEGQLMPYLQRGS